MPEDSGQERTEDATPRRKMEARRKGNVAKSIELNNAIVMLGISLCLPAFIGAGAQQFTRVFSKSFSAIPYDLSDISIHNFSFPIIQASLYILGPVIFISMILGLLSNFSQVGFLFSLESLKPSLNKLNPLNGFKKLFSRRSAVEAIKTMMKSFLFAYIAWSQISSSKNELMSMAWISPLESMILIGNIIGSIMLKISIIWLCIAALDYYFQRTQMDKQLKMTKQELKQEMKDQEVSAELKGAQARRRRQMSRRRLREQIPTADAIITNPTHYAVAIKYDRSKMHAPMVIAKGQDYLAQTIRELANEHRIPIIPNPPLARNLYRKCEIGDFIPREFYQAIAEVLSYVYKTLNRIR